jgi:dTDP-4-dehydrorhamnose 3,5-epimerase
MTFTKGSLPDTYILDPEKHRDDRGFFARAFCARTFAERGLNGSMVQTNVSFNTRRGTLRGMHFQRPPHREAKLVRCTRGRLYDVIVDVRPGSEAYGDWMGIELAADTHRMLYVPEGFAHGFLTLEDDTEVTYQVSAEYAPEAETGLRYDDPALGIEWPGPIRVISDKDRSWPALSPGAAPEASAESSLPSPRFP